MHTCFISQRLIALLSAVLCIVLAPCHAQAGDMSSYKTFGTVGKQLKLLTSKDETELFSYSGKGCLTHMWFGGNFKNWPQTRIRVYVDGEKTASIDMEMFLGVGIGFDDDFAPWGCVKLGKTGAPSGVYNTYHIPFGTGVRVTAQVPEGTPGTPDFWWIIRGTENLPVQIGGVTLPATARLKLMRVENHLAQPYEEIPMCDVKGSGAVYQVTIQANAARETGSWKDNSFMEGCTRAYIDGAEKPLLLSSGFEDYFVGTYYFNKGRYYTDLAGCTHIDLKKHEVSAYRFHDVDPVFFNSGLKLTTRCGDIVEGKPVGDAPPTRYTTYTWLYQW